MKPFLRLVAEDLYAKYGDDLSLITVVFPNNRARLFMGEFLAEIAGKPIWSPKYTTIQDLFAGCSNLHIPDSLKLVCDLFDVYNQNVPTPETFDEFYFWGEILLSDFDDVDKNRVDAAALFRNIKEQGEYIDTFEHLSDEQKSYLRMFFKNFSSDMRTELKERFLKLWDALINVYQDFRAKLESQGFAYEGMMNRIVLDKLRKEGLSGFDSEKYAFVGFNVLNECENELFSLLDNAGKALFYWDYDLFYTEKPYHEAGLFINKNRLRFHNELPKTVFNNFEEVKDRKFTFISSSTENAQARFLNSYLTNVKKEGEFKDADTAVVLCNEGLLLPVLHSVPDCVNDINVTMGFPLTQTPVYSLVLNLLDMQTSARKGKNGRTYRYVMLAPLLMHSYIRASMPEADELLNVLARNRNYYPSEKDLCRTENLTLLFSLISTPNELTDWLLKVLKVVAAFHRKEDAEAEESATDETTVLYDDLYKEALFRTYTQLSRINALQKEEQIEISLPVLVRLIKRLLSSISVPFSGEPVKGMQIMGFLETRNLDFKNIVMLSVNEGTLPNSGKETSFIPYNLRKGYGMTTIEHKNSLYAYYFYRLLQRAENVTMLYNSATEGMSRGQMSRFMLQLLAETDFDIKTYDIRSDVPIAEPNQIEVEKTDEIVNFLKNEYDIRCKEKAYLSPSALNAFIDCSLRFYFRYVKGLKVKDDLTEGIEPSMFGTIFHKSAELLYEELGAEKKLIQKETLEELASKDGRQRLEAYVDSAFRTEFFGKGENEEVPEYTGEQLINRKVIIDYLTKLIRLDAEYAPFSIQGLELPVYEQMKIKANGEELLVNIGGIVDRMDLKEGIFRIVDYKTGGTAKVDTIANIFEQKEKRANYLLQAFLYSAIRHRELQGQYEVKPAILYISKAMVGYSPDVQVLRKEDNKKETVDSIATYEEEYRSLLEYNIGRIFDKNEPFRQTSIAKSCEYCDYKEICRKRV
ncbi:MAG TPA: PD-(D/E)XK nuclease family protein [Paludibacteraceae bacterium]|nr:PD-(D/E)XK nuclease family protein [Paludibacteraceae bacterium]HQF50294.1 PD-(D/E)XK nuclease family protein [Paludibacteraceae bacterium]HQJ89495.1 PD-(D/E)XK nuclease family protein [Paludibacteraceae bacterium]